MTCRVEFTAGEDRHEWRMFILYKPQEDGDLCSKNGYWTTSCHECFVKNMVALRDNINEQLEAIPDSMRELA